MTPSNKAVLSLFVAAFMFGTWGILSRYLDQSFDLFYQFWTRYLFLSVIIFVILILRKNWKTIDKAKIPWFILRVVSGFITILFLYICFNKIPIGVAYFASYAGTIFGGIFIGSLLFKEKLSIVKVVAILLSLIGIYIIFSFGFMPSMISYLLLAVGSGIAYSAWYSCSKKISNDYSIIQIAFIDYFAGFILALVLSVFLQEKWVQFSLTFPWLMNLLFAITSIATGVLLIYGFKRIEVQIGTTIILTEVIFGIILGYVFFHENITTSTLIGGCMILVASSLPLLLKRRTTAKDT